MTNSHLNVHPAAPQLAANVGLPQGGAMVIVSGTSTARNARHRGGRCRAGCRAVATGMVLCSTLVRSLLNLLF